MNIDSIFENLQGFTNTEREWLKTKLKPFLKTNQAIAGKNVDITNDDSGQTINASDCGPCP